MCSGKDIDTGSGTPTFDEGHEFVHNGRMRTWLLALLMAALVMMAGVGCHAGGPVTPAETICADGWTAHGAQTCDAHGGPFGATPDPGVSPTPAFIVGTPEPAVS